MEIAAVETQEFIIPADPAEYGLSLVSSTSVLYLMCMGIRVDVYEAENVFAVPPDSRDNVGGTCRYHLLAVLKLDVSEKNQQSWLCIKLGVLIRRAQGKMCMCHQTER